MQILKKYVSGILISLLSLSLFAAPAYAQIALDDSFKATNSCPAVQSIRQGDNPGNIKLIPNKTYPTIGKNKDNPSHYLLKVDGATPSQRWVAKECGQLLSVVAGGGDNPQIPNPVRQENYVLALSWQPSFCETKPTKSECTTQTEARFDATNLALHGLFVPGSYCGVSSDIKTLDLDKKWDRLPPITLSPQIAQELAQKMPGFASKLYLHEWYKHGTCYGDAPNPDRYFADSMLLQDLVNSSKVRELFANNIDNVINDSEIRASFDDSFGTGAGKKITVECKQDIDEDRARMVTELQINLAGKIEPTSSFSNLIAAAKNGKKDSCQSGEVDRAGINN